MANGNTNQGNSENRQNAVSINPKCGFGIEIGQKVRGLEESNKQQWELLKTIQNRPPVWATSVISILTFLLGIAVTVAVHSGIRK